MINHFIQWYVDLFTFRAGNLSLRFSYSICRGLVRDNVCRARGSGYEDGREEVMLLKGEIGSSATFLLGARTRFGSYNASTIVCFTEHFMGLTTLSSGYSKLFLEKFWMKFKVDSVELRHKMVVPNWYSGCLSLKTIILTNFHQKKNSRKACVV